MYQRFPPHSPKRGAPPKKAPPRPNPRVERTARLKTLLDQGIPEKLALQVVTGQRTLNQVVELMAREDQVRLLQAQHGLPRALACQVVLNQVDLQKVLVRKALDAYRAAQGERSVFDAALASGETFQLGCHGRRSRNVVVTKNDAYEVEIRDPETGVTERLHKTQVKYACKAEDGRMLRRVMTWDKTLRTAEVEPKLRPQDRYDASDRWLFQQLNAKARLLVTLVEGEQLRGTLTWLGRYEIGLALKGGPEIVVLRHSLADVHED